MDIHINILVFETVVDKIHILFLLNSSASGFQPQAYFFYRKLTIFFDPKMCFYILFRVPLFHLLILQTNTNSKELIIIVSFQYCADIHGRYAYFVVYARMMSYCRNFNLNTIRTTCIYNNDLIIV